MSFPTYLCENGHTFEMVDRDLVCPVCKTPSESRRIANGGLGRVYYMSESYGLQPLAPGIERDWPDLTRTSAALEAFDASDEHWMDDGPLCRAVGAAFAADTADRNSPDVADLIRPGPKTPQPGAELSFVRRCVAHWRAEQESACST